MQFHGFAQTGFGSNPRVMRALMALGAVATLALAGCGSDSRTPSVTTCGGETCGGTNLCCTDTCVNPNLDPSNCGGCGVVCATGQYCSSGTCTSSSTTDAGVDAGGSTSDCPGGCPTGQYCSDGTCLNSDLSNCNGVACDPLRANQCGTSTSGTPACMCGDIAQCSAGTVCAESDGVYFCSNVNFDPQNCGSLGNACTDGESCVGGVCQCGSTGTSCAAGQGCCNGACVDITSDAENCGSCGNLCGPNAPNCNAGTCGCGTGPACTAPSIGGDTSLPIPLPIPIPIPGLGEEDLGQSCCDGACVDNSDANCGCGTTCAGTDDDSCHVGSSGLATVIPGTGGSETSDDSSATVCCGGDEISFLGCDGFAFPSI